MFIGSYSIMDTSGVDNEGNFRVRYVLVHVT